MSLVQPSFQIHCEKVKEEQEKSQIPTTLSSKHPDLNVIEPQTVLFLPRYFYYFSH